MNLAAAGETNSSTSANIIVSIDNDAMAHIFSFLNPTDFFRSGATCTAFRTLTHMPSSLRNLTLEAAEDPQFLPGRQAALLQLADAGHGAACYRLALGCAYHPRSMAEREAPLEDAIRLLRRALVVGDEETRADAAYELWLLTRRMPGLDDSAEALLAKAATDGHSPARFAAHRSRSSVRRPGDFATSVQFEAAQAFLVAAFGDAPLDLARFSVRAPHPVQCPPPPRENNRPNPELTRVRFLCCCYRRPCRSAATLRVDAGACARARCAGAPTQASPRCTRLRDCHVARACGACIAALATAADSARRCTGRSTARSAACQWTPARRRRCYRQYDRFLPTRIAVACGAGGLHPRCEKNMLLLARRTDWSASLRRARLIKRHRRCQRADGQSPMSFYSAAFADLWRIVVTRPRRSFESSDGFYDGILDS